ISMLFIILTICYFKQIQSDYQAEIEAKGESLLLMNEDKERLFSIVSHDIKGPLLSLENTLEMYRSDLLKRDDMIDATESLHKKIAHLNSTVEVLLRWSTLGMQGIRTRPTVFPLAGLVNEVVH